MELSRQRNTRKEKRRESSSLLSGVGGGERGDGDRKKCDMVVVGASILDWTARIVGPQIMVSEYCTL